MKWFLVRLEIFNSKYLVLSLRGSIGLHVLVLPADNNCLSPGTTYIVPGITRSGPLAQPDVVQILIKKTKKFGLLLKWYEICLISGTRAIAKQ